MSLPVVNGAVLQCSFGAAPGSLVVAPINKVMFENKPVANIMDHKPMVNIMPFGVCMTITNPLTAAQTAAALGVLTPGACIPATSAPWAPGAPKTMVANFPALTDQSMCVCAYGGVVKVVVGQAFKEQVG
jgi:hypothetical protein